MHIHKLVCPKRYTPEERKATKILVKNLPKSKNVMWTGIEDGVGRTRGSKLAQATKSSKNGKNKMCRQTDIRSFDTTTQSQASQLTQQLSQNNGPRTVRLNICQKCQINCGSGKLQRTGIFKNLIVELRLYRLHSLCCPSANTIDELRKIRIHISADHLQHNHIWSGDEVETPRKVPKRKRKRSESPQLAIEAPNGRDSPVLAIEPPRKKSKISNQTAITAFFNPVKKPQ